MTLTRHPGGPILTRQDLPACPPRVVDPSSVFNPGAISRRSVRPSYGLLQISEHGAFPLEHREVSLDG